MCIRDRSTAILLPPVVPIRNEDGSFGSAFGLENPVAAVTQYSNFVDRNRLIGSVNASYNIIDDLSVNARLGVDLLSLTEDVLEPRTLQSSATGTAVFGTVTNNRFIHEYFLKYNAKVGGGSLQALAGLSFQEDALKNSFIEVVDFPTDDFTGISSGSTTVNALGAEQGDNLQSYFGNINYNYKGKYYLTATFRADGSSRFINNQWGYFPGVSAAWNITEDLMKGAKTLNLLKLRVGWGQTGNNVIGDFISRQVFTAANIAYAGNAGTVPARLGTVSYTHLTLPTICSV